MVIGVSTVSSVEPGPTQITGCLRSKLVQVRKNGSHFVDPTTKKYPTLKMTASISPPVSPEAPGKQVSQFVLAAGRC